MRGVHERPSGNIQSSGDLVSILFSRQCEYALQAILYLALRPDAGAIPIKELADHLGLPFHFLAKILQKLRRDGILRSVKGASGGFGFARPIDEITLMDIVRAIDGPNFLEGCVLGFEKCSGESPCSLHELWAVSRDGIIARLGGKTVGEMAEINKQESVRV